MHVAILGAGALGRVYGVRLAAAGTRVTFVTRAGRPPAHGPWRLERVEGDQRKDALADPASSDAVPEDAGAVLVCVRADQLDGDVDKALATNRQAPIVLLTPVMPVPFAALTRSLGARVRAGMPGVVAYTRTAEGGDVTRYWLPRAAPTLIDGAEPDPPRALVQSLMDAGLPARLEPDVCATNTATTVGFIPLAMGLDAAGGIDALLGERVLLSVTLAAAKEGSVLSRRLGKAAAWAGLLTRFLGPVTLRAGVALGRRASPEVFAYVEEHFGHKLHAQNVAMARAMIELAKEKDTPREALTGLLARLEQRP